MLGWLKSEYRRIDQYAGYRGRCKNISRLIYFIKAAYLRRPDDDESPDTDASIAASKNKTRGATLQNRAAKHQFEESECQSRQRRVG